MDNLSKFGTAINCIDGRVQAIVAEWIKLHGHVQYVDMITEPGVDKVLSEESNSYKINSIAEKVKISIEAHQSSIIAVVGHFDCAANNVDLDTHKEQVKLSFEYLKSWHLGVRVVGLYANEWNSIDLICDTEAEFEQMRSFL